MCGYPHVPTFCRADCVVLVGHHLKSSGSGRTDRLRELQDLRLIGNNDCMQTIVPEAGDRDHNTCKDGVAPGAPTFTLGAQISPPAKQLTTYSASVLCALSSSDD